MNKPIARVFAVVVVLFAALVAFTSRWTVFDADALRANSLNKRQLIEQLRVRRGEILAGDGSTIARSVRAHNGTWRRRYPDGTLFSHPIGYSYVDQQAGLERYRNDELIGRTGTVGSFLRELRGRPEAGDEVRTTLDPAAQRAALDALAGRKGAVVALDPRNGAVKAMVSVPAYDPNKVVGSGAKAYNHAAGSPLLDRATQGAYPPGSTFKVVTAVAAIDSGKYTPDSTIDGDSPITVSGRPLSNDGDADFGPITLTTALTHSVNTVFAQLGEAVGKQTMAAYMKRFGFYSKPPLDLPADEMRVSGEYRPGTNSTLGADSGLIDVGRMAIGQDKLEVTPLQMAMVASAVADGGKLMTPHLTDEVVDPDGRVVDRVEPHLYQRVMSADTANRVGEMMVHVVEEGTGTAAALQGLAGQVAGKTGTADVGGCSDPDDWFIAFAPVDAPRVAVAAMLECQPGEGGTVAAPVAKQVMETLLREHG